MAGAVAAAAHPTPPNPVSVALTSAVYAVCLSISSLSRLTRRGGWASERAPSLCLLSLSPSRPSRLSIFVGCCQSTTNHTGTDSVQHLNAQQWQPGLTHMPPRHTGSGRTLRVRPLPLVVVVAAVAAVAVVSLSSHSIRSLRPSDTVLGGHPLFDRLAALRPTPHFHCPGAAYSIYLVRGGSLATSSPTSIAGRRSVVLLHCTPRVRPSLNLARSHSHARMFVLSPSLYMTIKLL